MSRADETAVAKAAIARLEEAHTGMAETLRRQELDLAGRRRLELMVEMEGSLRSVLQTAIERGLPPHAAFQALRDTAALAAGCFIGMSSDEEADLRTIAASAQEMALIMAEGAGFQVDLTVRAQALEDVGSEFDLAAGIQHPHSERH